MYFQWTCINVNRKDVHASMISFNGKYIKNMGACHGFKKNETATMFFLKKPSIVFWSITRPTLRATWPCGFTKHVYYKIYSL